MLMGFGNRSRQIPFLTRQCNRSRWHVRQDLAQTSNSASPDPDFAKQQVSDNADDRQGRDDGDPSNARRWIPVGPQHHAYDQEQFHQQVNSYCGCRSTHRELSAG